MESVQLLLFYEHYHTLLMCLPDMLGKQKVPKNKIDILKFIEDTCKIIDEQSNQEVG